MNRIKVTVRELRANLAKYLQQSTEVIDGKSKQVVAIISPPGRSEDEKDRQIQLLQARILELEATPPPYRTRDREVEAIAPLLEGRCVIPYCRGYGPYRDDFEVWDETYGEMKPVKGCVCSTHYKKK